VNGAIFMKFGRAPTTDMIFIRRLAGSPVLFIGRIIRQFPALCRERRTTAIVCGP
jgi:hypothetical protein